MTRRVVLEQMLRWYEPLHPEFKRYAKYLRDRISEFLDKHNFELHAVTARAKDLNSLRHKLFTKPYKKPRVEITDLIGVRVIVYYEADVDLVATRLREYLRVNKKESVDKREDLDPNEFGYRSFHLIAKLEKNEPNISSFGKEIRGRWFEVQVRSVLEHAWAEIQHEVVYKAAINFPPQIKREFAAIAGGLEILDREFLRLRKQYEESIEAALGAIRAKKRLDEKLDVSKLLAALEAVYPQGASFRATRKSADPFPAHIEAQALAYLIKAGIRSPRLLLEFLRSNSVRNVVKQYHRLLSTSGEYPSHLAILAFAVGMQQPEAFRTVFSELLADQEFGAIVQRRGFVS